MARYKCLNVQEYEIDDYRLVPIRYEDRYTIMKWRNEQIYHLRQDVQLTEEVQDDYFTRIVSSLFEQDHPSQILFSFLQDEKLIGYGGLVHINWADKHAEISFLLDTNIGGEDFVSTWCTYLNLIEKVAFMELQIHKVFIYSYDVRPELYLVTDRASYNQEALLREQHFDGERFVDVKIHSKIER